MICTFFLRNPASRPLLSRHTYLLLIDSDFFNNFTFRQTKLHPRLKRHPPREPDSGSDGPRILIYNQTEVNKISLVGNLK